MLKGGGEKLPDEFVLKRNEVLSMKSGLNHVKKSLEDWVSMITQFSKANDYRRHHLASSDEEMKNSCTMIDKFAYGTRPQVDMLQCVEKAKLSLVNKMKFIDKIKKDSENLDILLLNRNRAHRKLKETQSKSELKAIVESPTIERYTKNFEKENWKYLEEYGQIFATIDFLLEYSSFNGGVGFAHAEVDLLKRMQSSFFHVCSSIISPESDSEIAALNYLTEDWDHFSRKRSFAVACRKTSYISKELLVAGVTGMLGPIGSQEASSGTWSESDIDSESPVCAGEILVEASPCVLPSMPPRSKQVIEYLDSQRNLAQDDDARSESVDVVVELPSSGGSLHFNSKEEYFASVESIKSHIKKQSMRFDSAFYIGEVDGWCSYVNKGDGEQFWVNKNTCEMREEDPAGIAHSA